MILLLGSKAAKFVYTILSPDKYMLRSNHCQMNALLLNSLINDFDLITYWFYFFVVQCMKWKIITYHIGSFNLYIMRKLWYNISCYIIFFGPNKYTFLSKPSLNDVCKRKISSEWNLTDDVHYVEIRNSVIINISIKFLRYH